jgi:ACS family hexuronate transporter-like MFS transporter
VGRVRWVVCALLFFATTINYVDRQVLGILAPDLQRSIGWNEVEYGYIVTAFQGAYALGLLVAGRILDRVGTKRGFAVAIVVWSLASMAHAFARSALGFGIARFVLGLGESANFPASIKTVAEWFPRKERAFATGLFNAGSNLGAIVAPAVVPVITLAWGWPWAFVLTGAVGFVWLLAWLGLYATPDDHPRLTPRERAHIRSDEEEPSTPIPWLTLLGRRQAWAVALGKFLTDPIWWFYLFWLPKFLNERHGLGLAKVGAPLVTIYLIADVGSVGGGWLSSTLIARGFSVNAARKVTMLACALAVVPIVFAPWVESLWGAVALIGLATAGHQGWSANIYTLASDMFPRRAVASVIGFAGMAGAVGGMLIATATGYLLQWTGSYWTLFALAGSAYLVALATIQILVPRMQPAEV